MAKVRLDPLAVDVARPEPSVVRRDDRSIKGKVEISIVILTYARDDMVGRAIQQAALVAGGRQDVEFILVDNNADGVDRWAMLAPFARVAWVKVSENEGVSARNHGTAISEGDYILYVDDDSLLYPLNALDIFKAAFDANPKLAIVNARIADEVTGLTPNRFFPHNDKTLDKTKPHKIFRFQGSGHMLRRSALESVGMLSTDYFYGYEEMDYAYRLIASGFEILYEPRCWIIEYNHPGGRRPNSEIMRMRLRNKLINSYKHLPTPYFQINAVLFPVFLFVQRRGQVNILGALKDFVSWCSANPGSRRPLGPAALDYIRACGGTVWR